MSRHLSPYNSAGILSIPPTPALLDEFMIEIHPVEQDHVSKDACVPVEAARLDAAFFPKSYCSKIIVASCLHLTYCPPLGYVVPRHLVENSYDRATQSYSFQFRCVYDQLVDCSMACIDRL